RRGGMSNTIELKVPDIGDFDEVEVIEVLVAQGDTIEAEQSLVTVESDKASMEIPAEQAGVIKALRVKVGDKVAKGSVLLELEPAQEASPGKPAAESATSAETAPSAGAGTDASRTTSSGDGEQKSETDAKSA